MQGGFPAFPQMGQGNLSTMSLGQGMGTGMTAPNLGQLLMSLMGGNQQFYSPQQGVPMSPSGPVTGGMAGGQMGGNNIMSILASLMGSRMSTQPMTQRVPSEGTPGSPNTPKAAGPVSSHGLGELPGLRTGGSPHRMMF